MRISYEAKDKRRYYFKIQRRQGETFILQYIHTEARNLPITLDLRIFLASMLSKCVPFLLSRQDLLNSYDIALIHEWLAPYISPKYSQMYIGGKLS